MDLTLTPPRTPADWEAMYDLRFRVLRQPWSQPRGSERAPDDAAAFHLIARAPDGQVVGTGRLHFNSAAEGQIRFMAVDPSWQGRGVGSAVLAALEAEARRQGARCVVLDAREAAVKFYHDAHYRLVAPGHLLFGQIPHWRMEKELKG